MNLWRSIPVVGLGLALVVACSERPATEPPELAWRPFDDGPFHAQLPDWPEGSSLREGELIQVGQQDQALTVARQPGVPRLVGEYTARALPDFGDFESVEISESRVDRVVLQALADTEPRLRLRMVFLYCGGDTYFLTAAALEANWPRMAAIQEQAVDSVQCADGAQMASSRAGMTGMVISPPGGEFTYESYRRAAALARSAGLEAAHVYIPWGEIETEAGHYDWTITDLLLDTLSLEGLRLSAVIEYIHTSVRGPTPPDLEGLAFDDPSYVQRAADFAAAVAERYGDQLDYLALGNEVNIYFDRHPDELDPYLWAFQQMRIAATGARLDLPIGATLAFHEAQRAGRFDLVEAFKRGDFLAYTYYPHEPGFRYDVPTDRFGSALVAMADASGDTPFIVVENGFSSADSLGSSPARQAEYVRRSMDAWLAQPAPPNRQIWLQLHDPPGGCRQSALSFFPDDFDPAAADPAAWRAFQEYLCTLGFRESSGEPKEAWDALTEYLTPPD